MTADYSELDSVEFSYQEVTGIGQEKGINSRDPSDIIKIDNKYYIRNVTNKSDIYKEQLKMKRKNGFTLIELLVVIAIIALLLAILMPALTKAKIIAKGTVCQTQAKQWGLAWTLYANDHDFNTIDHNASMFWFYKIAPYLSDRNFATEGGYTEGAMKIMHCPSTKRWGAGASDDFSWGSYGSADKMWRFKQSQGTGSDGTYTEGSYTANAWMLSTTSATNSEKYFRKMTRARSDTPLLSDGGYLRARPTTNDALKSSMLIDLKGAGLGDDGFRMSHSIERLILDRHNMASCVSFADGHAERIKLTKMWSLNWHLGFESVPELILPNN